ncbi:hypothetical protein AK812_SmicGene7944 [Symbiodinium microadriaticum]|uniref:Uncharacterized protein n=1 Tax=Symbiodinium microadriaticum TaxID=2951 RepID=A0A1Q9EMB3_SYMMI|nr:hypothetical protein AK812_SmicGene7944 [Symbiodinium microadriaticum]
MGTFISDSYQETLRLTRALELLLAEEGPYADEKVLQLAWAEMPEATGHFFAVALGFVRKNSGIKVDHSPHLRKIRSLQVVEVIGPGVWEGKGELSRIYSASDAQLLVVGRLAKTKLGEDDKGLLTCSPRKGIPEAETSRGLMTLSGQSAPSRVKIQQEMLVDKAAKSKTASRIARTTWAYREADEGDRLSLFVLTELNFFELEVEDEKGHVSENEYDGGESDEDVGEPR